MSLPRSLSWLLLPLLGILAGCATQAERPYARSVYLYDYDPYWSFYYEPFYWPYDSYCGGFCGSYEHGYYAVAYCPPHRPGHGWPHPPWHGGPLSPGPGSVDVATRPLAGGFHPAPPPAARNPARLAARPAAPVRAHSFSRSRGR